MQVVELESHLLGKSSARAPKWPRLKAAEGRPAECSPRSAERLPRHLWVRAGGGRLEGPGSWRILISTYVPLPVSYTAHMATLDFLNLRGHWSGLPFPSPVDHTVSDLSTMPARLGWPHRAWLSFIELDKAVVLVWLDWLIFCVYGFSVSALWCPLGIPTVSFWFLLPWTWGISSQLLQQSAAAALYLGRGVSPHHRPSRPWTWNSSSCPPAPAQPPLQILYCSGNELLYVTMGKFHNPWAIKEKNKKPDRKELRFMC